MIRTLYDWMMAKAAHKHALWWLAGFSFVESSFFPIPPDVLLIPMILAAPTRWFKLALLCSVSSVLGGYLGYAIGFYAMESVGVTILQALGLLDGFYALQPMIDQYGVWIIIVKGATPIPYKLITIAAGAFEFDLVKFTAASLIARGFRFLLIALLLWKFGVPIRNFIEKRLTLVTTVAVVLLIGGFLVVSPLVHREDAVIERPQSADDGGLL